MSTLLSQPNFKALVIMRLQLLDVLLVGCFLRRLAMQCVLRYVLADGGGPGCLFPQHLCGDLPGSGTAGCCGHGRVVNVAVDGNV